MAEKFNQAKYVQEWSNKNMKLVGSRYKNDFVDEYKKALAYLNLKNSDMIRIMMNSIIEEAKSKGMK